MRALAVLLALVLAFGAAVMIVVGLEIADLRLAAIESREEVIPADNEYYDGSETIALVVDRPRLSRAASSAQSASCSGSPSRSPAAAAACSRSCAMVAAVLLVASWPSHRLGAAGAAVPTRPSAAV